MTTARKLPWDESVDTTLVACLSRLSQALQRFVREVAEPTHLSPDQIRFMMYLRNATPRAATIMDLSRTFLLGHPTVSESMRALIRRKLVKRIPTGPGRRARLELTGQGKKVTEKLTHYANPLQESMSALHSGEKFALLFALLKIIKGLQDREAIPPTRLCVNCVHFHPNEFEAAEAPHRCDDYGIALATGSLRLECPEYAEAPIQLLNQNWKAFLEASKPH
ncbi:MAG: MarR family winged helix-turn-helix transcriptional regulator [bacterium]